MIQRFNPNFYHIDPQSIPRIVPCDDGMWVKINDLVKYLKSELEQYHNLAIKAEKENRLDDMNHWVGGNSAIVEILGDLGELEE